MFEAYLWIVLPKGLWEKGKGKGKGKLKKINKLACFTSKPMRKRQKKNSNNNTTSFQSTITMPFAVLFNTGAF